MPWLSYAVKSKVTVPRKFLRAVPGEMEAVEQAHALNSHGPEARESGRS